MVQLARVTHSLPDRRHVKIHESFVVFVQHFPQGNDPDAGPSLLKAESPYGVAVSGMMKA